MLRRKAKCDLKKLFDEMNLPCVYRDKTIYTELINNNKYYVYLIRNEMIGYYYVGSSSNMVERIKNHRCPSNNTACFNNGETIVYILEEFDERDKMIEMEKLWIYWFYINSNYHLTKNKKDTDYKLIIKGVITNKKIDNTNYKKLVDKNIIYGLTFYNNKQDITKLSYQTQERKRIEEIEENKKDIIRMRYDLI
jgi:predicted GIY-YIG superfamily endonuclease